MEIRKRIIEKLIEVWNKNRDLIINGKLKGFTTYYTEGKDKIITTKLKNDQGWYAIVLFYECTDLVEVYDMHVFSRYQERFKIEKPITNFIKRGNADGTIFIRDEDNIEKKIKDGAIFGEIKNNIIYYKTYITDKMIIENNKNYLFELG